MSEKKEVKISERILKVHEEQERLKDMKGGKQIMPYLPYPHKAELDYLCSVLNERFGIRGHEKVIGLATRLLREAIEDER